MADSDRDLLYKIALQLESWAEESRQYGWSTHQVAPQRQLAETILAHLARTDKQYRKTKL